MLLSPSNEASLLIKVLAEKLWSIITCKHSFKSLYTSFELLINITQACSQLLPEAREDPNRFFSNLHCFRQRFGDFHAIEAKVDRRLEQLAPFQTPKTPPGFVIASNVTGHRYG